MQLYTTCQHCQSTLTVKSSCATRSELQMEKGDFLSIYCSGCEELKEKHVNDIRAKTDGRILLIGLIASIIVSVILWFVLGAIGTLSILIVVLFAQQEMKAVKGFNSYLVRRKKSK